MSNQNDDSLIATAVAQLASVFNQTEEYVPSTGEFKDAVWVACQRLANVLQITLTKPIAWSSITTVHGLVMGIVRDSQIRVRRVMLSGEWWKMDNGPILAFSQKSHQPFALVREGSSYQLIDPVTGKLSPVTPELIESLFVEAYMFYPSFPNEKLNLLSLIRFVFRGQKREIKRILLLQAGVGLLALLVPVATGILLNNVIPNAEIGLLWQWLFALGICAVSAALFTGVQMLCTIRLRFKTNAYTQAAVWDRLLRLPVTFFRQFSPGDLTQRASGIDNIQQELTNASMQTLLGGVFSLFTLALMFYYSPLLASVALVLLLIIAVLTIFNAYMQLRYQRPIFFLRGKLASLTLQFLTSIAKLRVSHSEARAFSLWSQPFATKNQFSYKASLWQISFTTTVALLGLLGFVGLYALVGSGVVEITFGAFIAFNAAFGQFFAAVMSFTSVFIVLLQLTPQYERILPILQASPEVKEHDESLTTLVGAVSVKKVSFSYSPETPLILDHVSVDIQPGEMVAFVGPTGCGKSTLIRLLLGFETPDSGQIFYDHHNMATLNLRSIREQLGVVMQNNTLMTGSIFDNIRGTQEITMDEAWEAAEQACIAEEINAMPMGMFTLVAEWGKTLSVGQRQRLMIARALIHKPKMLILDEATSALDNPTQAKVMRHFEQMAITRIVVAHRLSTIEKADRIYVMEAGQIIQTGNYAELMKEGGLFAELVKQQMV